MDISICIHSSKNAPKPGYLARLSLDATGSFSRAFCPRLKTKGNVRAWMATLRPGEAVEFRAIAWALDGWRGGVHWAIHEGQQLRLVAADEAAAFLAAPRIGDSATAMAVQMPVAGVEIWTEKHEQ